MTKFVLIAAVAVVLSGCVSYRGGSLGPDLQSADGPYDRGTTGVSSGEDPGPGITGSDAVPPRGLTR